MGVVCVPEAILEKLEPMYSLLAVIFESNFHMHSNHMINFFSILLLDHFQYPFIKCY